MSRYLGRLLQGVSGGFIAVVVPLYLAECLGAQIRGRGTAIFQFMLTFGIVIAALTGTYYAQQAEAAIRRSRQCHSHPGSAGPCLARHISLGDLSGLLFFLGSFFLTRRRAGSFVKESGRRAECSASRRAGAAGTVANA